MICANPNCNNEIIGRRSDANSCSIKCSSKIKWIKEKEKNRYRSNQVKQYYFKNKEKLKLKDKEYRKNNKEKIAFKVKQQRIRDSEQYKKRSKEAKKRYIEKNREKYILLNREQSAKRRAKLLRAIPKFANLEKIKEIYKNCPKGYEVDHIIPLQGKNVSGFHIETNLQYLPMLENRVKSNKFIVG